MKKFRNLMLILVSTLVIALCISAFACTPKDGEDGTPDLTNLNGAKDYIDAQYKNAATDTPASYTLPSKTSYQGALYDIVWTINVSSGDANAIVLGEVGADGYYPVTIDAFATAEVVYTLTATISDADGNTVSLSYNRKVPYVAPITVAEFLAKEVDSETVYSIVGYVMASAASEGKTASFVIGDETGAVFSYNKFEVFTGDKVKVWGTRSVNYELPQIGTTNVQVINDDSTTNGYAEATATELAAADINLASLTNEATAAMAGTYYKITGATLVKESSGYTNAYYNGAQLLQLYPSDEVVDACADFYNYTVDVYGYVRGSKSGSYLTIHVTKIEINDANYTPSTPADRVAHEKANIALDNIAKTGDVELPTTGDRYADVAISWALTTNDYATLEGNVLTVSALPSATLELSLTATFTCGDVSDTATVTVNLVAENSFISTAIKAGEALVQGTTTTDSYILIGTVSEITSAYSSSYGNVSFNITDGANELLVFRYNLEDAATLAVGDFVAFAAPIKNYEGTIEAVSTFVKLDVTTLAAAAEAGLAGTGADGTLVYGKISEINTAYSSSFGNITFTISDGTNSLYCYRVVGGEDLAVGDYVLITGKPSAYQGSAQLAQGATYTKSAIYVAPAEKPDLTTEFTTTDYATLNALVSSEIENSTDAYYAIGYVKSFNYKTLVIEDAEGNTLTAYQTYTFDGEIELKDYTTQPEVGSVVVLYGKMNYYNAPQMKNAKLVQIGTEVCTLTADHAWLVIDVPTSVSANFTLPTIDGATLTWSVKSGTGIAIEGTAATVTQTADVQEVVITASLVIGSAEAVTKDYTVQVAAALQTGAVTITKTIADLADANSWANDTAYASFTLDDVITVTGGGKYYTSGEGYRLYQADSNTITITAATGYEIVSVQITYSISNSGCLTNNGSNIASNTVVTVDGSTITFGVGNTGDKTNGQARVTSITVIYAPVEA